MKIMYKAFLIMIAFIAFASCVEEQSIKVDPQFILSFERDGEQTALTGTTFYVLPTGSGEFTTLFDGTKGHVWGEPGATGTDFNKQDSLGVTYPNDTIYNLTVVSTSTSNFGKTVTRTPKTVAISAVDARNTFADFKIKISGVLVTGTITSTDSILFNVVDVTPIGNFTPTFTTLSPKAKVYVKGVLQVSDVTVNDFSQPVIYTVKSPNDAEKSYVVKFSTFPSSVENKMLTFNLTSVTTSGGNGEIGVINEADSTISIAGNYGSNLTKVKVVAFSSYLSTITINGIDYLDRTFYNLSSLNNVKDAVVVKAQNVTKIHKYTLHITAQDPVQTFTFAGLIPAPVGVIDKTAKTITVNVLAGTDITKLIAVWKGSVGSVKVGGTSGVLQTNGTTPNDFTTPLTYTFYKGTTVGDSYTVTVNVK